jgi:hypothetical protein
MTTSTTNNKSMLAFRATPRENHEVRQLAEAEGESVSVVLRRLFRRGLAAEQRTAQHTEQRTGDEAA